MKWPHTPHRIVATTEAIAVMNREAHNARKVDKERGGSLIGVQAHTESLILYAIPTGPSAVTSWGRITTDAVYQNKCIAAVHAYYSSHGIQLVYLCDYHVHQMGLESFSPVDLIMLGEIMADEAYAYLHGLPTILLSFRGDQVVYIPWWIPRNSTKTVTVEKAVLEVVGPDDGRIMNLLKGQPFVPLASILQQKMPDEKRPSLVSQADVCSGDTLSIRLALEISQISSVFSAAPILRRTVSGHPCIVTTINNYSLYAVIPSEFPLNPASILVRPLSGGALREYHPRRSWNSIARISDIFEEFLDSVNHKTYGAHWINV